MDKEKVVRRNNPSKTEAQLLSPFTVGNGEIAYTVDVTGMQTLYKEQEEAGFPLLTMSENGWHTILNEYGGIYELDKDFVMTQYKYGDGYAKYAVEKKPGNEAVYHWLRENPHRYNLLRTGLIYQGREIRQEEITDMHQSLDLYTGLISSSFSLFGKAVEIETVCHQDRNILGIRIASELCEQGLLQVLLAFPYGSSSISGSDWSKGDLHKTSFCDETKNSFCVLHNMDDVCDRFGFFGENAFLPEQKEAHRFVVTPREKQLTFTVSIAHSNQALKQASFAECLSSSEKKWERFWQNGGLISFEGSTNPLAPELERRIVLSLYLSAINSCNHMPPQETGLTVNSWYGKAHLEMYMWHLAYLPLWGRSELLKKSLPWYHKIVPEAIKNAKRNGYSGARWPKMVGPEGIDCPSKIATLLIWQQPHINFMLEMLYQQEPEKAFLEEHWPLVEQSAIFMADFAAYNEQKNVYELTAPLIPAQERHKPQDTLNPVYELEYWRLGLEIAVKWAERLGKEFPQKWSDIIRNMAKPAIEDGRYLAHELCHDTYTRFAEDHPSMVAALGLLPGERINKQVMRNTLDEIYRVWNFNSMWGWDFAMMAMTETRLGNSKKALEILLLDTAKNKYMTNGHNCQISRSDLPLYLPGNGSLLLTIPLMAVGYPGCTSKHPGFPEDGTWNIETEGISPYTF